MASLAVKLPLTYNASSGFTNISNLIALTRQNFKMLVLTNPGERIMEPNYGVGLKTYLFTLHGENVRGEINKKILKQTSIYMPHVQILSIDFGGTDIDTHTLSMQINYSVPALGISDLLNITI